MSVKYRGTSFDAWKKANGYTDDTSNGIVQKAGMSDADYEIGQKLYNAYLRGNEATTARDVALSQLESDKADSARAAEVSYMRLQKYLPQQLAKQGLYSKGVTEDAYLKLHNNYMNNLNEIGKEYGDRKTELEQAYRSDANTREIALGEDVQGVLDRQNTSNLENYNEANEFLQSGSFTSAQDVVAALEQYRGKVSDTQYKMLENTAASLIKAYGYDANGLDDGYIKNTVNAGKINTVRATDYDSLQNGDDVRVSVGGSEFLVESNDAALSTAPAEYAAANGIKDGDFFVYPDEDNAVYVYKNGVAYSIVPKSRGDKNVANFNKLRHYLMTGETLETAPAGNTSQKKSADNRTKTQKGRGL